MSDATTDTNAFNPDKKTFTLLGKECVYQFIPSVHFQYILSLAIKLSLGLVTIGDERQVSEGQALSIGQILADALEGKQYEILQDVLKYQNNTAESLETLKYKTRPTEIANFMLLLLNDPEVKEAAEVMVNGMGKSVTSMLTLFQTPNSTPSS